VNKSPGNIVGSRDVKAELVHIGKPTWRSGMTESRLEWFILFGTVQSSQPKTRVVMWTKFWVIQQRSEVNESVYPGGGGCQHTDVVVVIGINQREHFLWIYEYRCRTHYKLITSRGCPWPETKNLSYVQHRILIICTGTIGQHSTDCSNIGKAPGQQTAQDQRSLEVLQHQ